MHCTVRESLDINFLESCAPEIGPPLAVQSALKFTLKVHKHEIILIFFLPKSNLYIPFVNFRKEFRFFSFDFRQNFDVIAC
jgi:hypothetical protein